MSLAEYGGMARMRTQRISRPAQVGLFILAAIALLIVALWLFLNFGRTHGGYRIAARFTTVSGLSPGAPVYFAGTNIGTVSAIDLLPDNSVDVIMSITRDTQIPRNSRFSILTSFTGSPSIAIAPPRTAAQAPLPKRILPESEQPVGTVPLSIDQLMAEGKTLGNRAKRVLAVARPHGAHLLASVRDSRANAAATFTELKGAMPAALASMQSTITTARANAAKAQGALSSRDRAKIAAAAASLQTSSAALDASASALKGIARDPAARDSVRAAARNLKAATQNLQATADAFKGIGGNAQVRAELHDASLHLHAVLAKIKSLL